MSYGNYEFRYVRGHIEVFLYGVFQFSADTISEAQENRRKLQAKKARNFWTCARPVTQIVPNKRAYNRKREKNIKNKLKTEGEE